jgi:hypothetical protein
MQLRIIPPPPLPNVLFHLSFSNLPPTVLIPNNWLSQLDVLNEHDLEAPGPVAGMHALDRAACLVNLLEEVVFDVPNGLITCSFLDGAREEWALGTDGCDEALQRVMEDVHEATLEKQREEALATAAAAREEAAKAPLPPVEVEKKDTSREATLPPPATSSSAQGWRPKHKKQRSSLMSFVAYVSSYSLVLLPSDPRPSSFLKPSPLRPVPTLPIVAPPPSSSLPSPAPPRLSPPIPPSRTGLNSNLLRRRARSQLVDIYALFVLSELRARLAVGPRGYPAWIASSMLRRADNQLSALRAKFGMAVVTPPAFADALCGGPDSTLLGTSPSNSQAEDDRASLAPSLTDAASDADSELIRTPPDSLSRSQSLLPTPASDLSDSPLSSVSPCSSASGARLVSSASPTADDVATYAFVASTASRLRGALGKMRALERGRKLSEASARRVLEARARRRAWSTRSLGPDPSRGALSKDWRMSLPERKSPLGMYVPVTAEALERAHEEARAEATRRHLEMLDLRVRSPPPRDLTIASGPHDLSDLFSYAEGDDDEGMEHPAETSLLHESFPEDMAIDMPAFATFADGLEAGHGVGGLPFPMSPTDFPSDVGTHGNSWIPSVVGSGVGRGAGNGQVLNPSTWLRGGPSPKHVPLALPAPAPMHRVSRGTSSRPKIRTRSRSESDVVPVEIVVPSPTPNFDAPDWLQELEARDVV